MSPLLFLPTMGGGYRNMDIDLARSALLQVCYPGQAKQGWYQICRRELHPFLTWRYVSLCRRSSKYQILLLLQQSLQVRKLLDYLLIVNPSPWTLSCPRQYLELMQKNRSCQQDPVRKKITPIHLPVSNTILLFMFQRQHLCYIFINEPRLLSREGRALSYSSTSALKQLARENSHKHLIACGEVRFHALGLFLFRLSVFAYFLLPDLCAL